MPAQQVMLAQKRMAWRQATTWVRGIAGGQLTVRREQSPLAALTLQAPAWSWALIDGILSEG